MNKLLPWLIAAIAAAGIGAGLYQWQKQRSLKQVPPQPSAVVEAPASAPLPAEAAASEPAIRNPIEAAPAAAKEQPLASLPPLSKAAEADALVKDGLVELLGRSGALSFLNLDNFARRVVATVDNLPSRTMSMRLAPVAPAPQRFVVEQRSDGAYLGAANAARYEPFVRFVEGIDSARAAALYVRLYPLFQQAYAELGYPGRYFNDRVVEVIDHLLATPEPAGALKLHLTEVKGPIKPLRPWVTYEFDDPKLEARSAGQKILLRMGNANARRLKVKLTEVRQQIASGAAPR